MECVCGKVALTASLIGVTAYLGYSHLYKSEKNALHLDVENSENRNSGDAQSCDNEEPISEVKKRASMKEIPDIMALELEVDEGVGSLTTTTTETGTTTAAAALRRSSLQQFLYDEVELGELCVRTNNLVEGVEHLANAVLVCREPHALMDSLKERLDAHVYQMLVKEVEDDRDVGLLDSIPDDPVIWYNETQ